MVGKTFFCLTLSSVFLIAGFKFHILIKTKTKRLVVLQIIFNLLSLHLTFDFLTFDLMFVSRVCVYDIVSIEKHDRSPSNISRSRMRPTVFLFIHYSE